MIRVWTDARQAGVLDRLDSRGSTFAYDPLAPASRAVSLTMPVRVQSWDVEWGLAPIFDMNLPEGALRERLTRMFAKAQGRFDDFDLLTLVGRSQIGRLRYSGLDEDIAEAVPFQPIEEILKAKRDGGLFEHLLEQFARHSGLSGVQPKFMIRAAGKPSEHFDRRSPTIQSATHIVKLWDADEYPELAANEFFCLTAARAAGLKTPEFQLSEDGGALIIERFDRMGSRYFGFEDFCVLNGLPSKDKYDGGYETRLFRRFRDYLPMTEFPEAHRDLFRLFVLNCAVRNGDAHLKNFGLTYESVDAQANLAPVYDVITTAAYNPIDPMALTLEGSTRWPDAKRLTRLAQTRVGLSTRDVQEIFEMTGDAVAQIAKDMAKYFSRSEFAGIGERMASAWESGLKDSLGLVKGLAVVSKRAPSPRDLAKSDRAILEGLRAAGGALTGSQRQIGERLGLPVSTTNASINRLVRKGLVEVGARRVTLLDREVG